MTNIHIAPIYSFLIVANESHCLFISDSMCIANMICVCMWYGIQRNVLWRFDSHDAPTSCDDHWINRLYGIEQCSKSDLEGLLLRSKSVIDMMLRTFDLSSIYCYPYPTLRNTWCEAKIYQIILYIRFLTESLVHRPLVIPRCQSLWFVTVRAS